MAKNLPDKYIVLSNHVTDFDVLFVAASFPRQMYFVASEHIARWKNAYKFLKYCFEPIMRYKGSVAASTVMEVLRKIKAGANVCIFAEGRRCWDGVTTPILPSTGKMVKSARCGLVTYKINGGYFVSPNWSEGGTRRGPICGAPVNVYTKEQLQQMSVDEINEAIRRDLYEDAYETQLREPKRYTGKQLAYRMENLLFICPVCGKVDTMYSRLDTVSCKACHFKFQYNEYGMLKGAPFETVKELAAWQKEEVRKAVLQEASYTSHDGRLSQVAKHEEMLIATGAVCLSQETLSCGDVSISMSDILDMEMHGRHALVFSTQHGYYEMILPEDTNTLKFLLLFEGYRQKQG